MIGVLWDVRRALYFICCSTILVLSDSVSTDRINRASTQPYPSGKRPRSQSTGLPQYTVGARFGLVIFYSLPVTVRGKNGSETVEVAITRPSCAKSPPLVRLSFTNFFICEFFSFYKMICCDWCFVGRTQGSIFYMLFNYTGAFSQYKYTASISCTDRINRASTQPYPSGKRPGSNCCGGRAWEQ